MLTKSDFIKYLQCQKYLWLYKNRKDLLPAEISAGQAALFEGGFEVEKIAYQLFPDGEEAGDEDIKAAIAKTTKFLKQGAKVIYQPTLSNWNAGTFCRADIVVRAARGNSYDIYEVKSATSVKDVYLADIAFQKLCFEAAGVAVGRLSIVCVNNTYVRQGKVDPKKFLIIEDVTETVEALLGDKKVEIAAALKVLALKQEPAVRIINQCYDPYECPFVEYCWKKIPDDSLYDVSLSDEDIVSLLDDSVMSLKGVPEEMISRKLQKAYRKALRTGKAHINAAGIADWLGELAYPLYFLDYETWGSAVPAFDGYRPYQQIPFQYSLYVLAKPGAKLEHYEFLATEGGDPVPALAKALAKQIGPVGSVITWNMSFEKARNREMGEHLPRYAEYFEQVNERIVDLGKPFADGHYVHKSFRGSWSIKMVLPVLVPELSYDELEISNGGEASTSWPVLTGPDLKPADKNKLAADMLKYCQLDTLAMVRILEVLKRC